MSVKLALYLTNIKSVWFWVFVNYSCWYSLYSIPRTLINVSEATLFLVAFYLWKRSFDEDNWKMKKLSRVFIALNFCIRPTSIAIWAPIWLIQGFGNFNLKKFIVFCIRCFFNCVLLIVLSIYIDSFYFEKLTWTAFNFIKFNAIEDKSAQYGIYSPLWYFTAAIPMITLGWAFCFFMGAATYTMKKLGKKTSS